VRVATDQPAVTADDADPTPIVLTGELDGYAAGIPTTFRWRQLCGQADGPRACRPAERSATGPRLAAKLLPPKLGRPRTLRFGLTASGWRDSGHGETSVRVTPVRAAHPGPRLDRLRRVKHLRRPAPRAGEEARPAPGRSTVTC
jgi:hypothetical protein